MSMDFFKEWFFFDSPLPPQEGDAYRTLVLRRFARPPSKGGRGGSKTHFYLRTSQTWKLP